MTTRLSASMIRRHALAARRMGALAALFVMGCHLPAPSPYPSGAISALLAEHPKRLDAAAPDSFIVRFQTTKGPFDLMVHRDWAPNGADRLYWLFTHHYYDGARFFRTVPNFVTQFGLAADPRVSANWRNRRIQDDPVTRGNVRGTLSFATGGPNTRTTQLFINLKDNTRLDATGFAVLGQVIAGMVAVDSLYQGYGDGPPRGKGPSQDRIGKEGEEYLSKEFPLLDRIESTSVIQVFRSKH